MMMTARDHVVVLLRRHRVGHFFTALNRSGSMAHLTTSLRSHPHGRHWNLPFGTILF
jgi:hypothetical protein